MGNHSESIYHMQMTRGNHGFLSRGDIDKQTDGYFLAPPRPEHGQGYYAKPVNGVLTGVAGVHFGTRNGGVSDAKCVSAFTCLT